MGTIGTVLLAQVATPENERNVMDLNKPHRFTEPVVIGSETWFLSETTLSGFFFNNQLFIGRTG